MWPESPLLSSPECLNHVSADVPPHEAAASSNVPGVISPAEAFHPVDVGTEARAGQG